MKLIFCSSIYRMKTYEELSQKSKVPLSLADHNLNSSIIAGLDQVLGMPAALVNQEPLPCFPMYPQIVFRKKDWKHAEHAADQNCGYVNLPVMKQLTRAVTTYAALKKLVRQSKDRQIVILTYDLHWEICTAMAAVRRKYPWVHISAVLPDIPSVMTGINKGNRIKLKIHAKMKMSQMNRFDSYVLLTKYMTDYVDVRGKSYVVMEGIYREQNGVGQIQHTDSADLVAQNGDKKIVFYAGQLNSRYGIKNLAAAVRQIHKKHPEYELWICGGGELEGYLKEQARRDPSLMFYGYQNTANVRNLQQQATVLVNPRQNTGAYTRYSFPSKTMEYLASGKPVIGYKLDGIPDEYDPWIYYVQGNSLEALAQKIIEVCELPLREREAVGVRSREFVLQKKNPGKMCERIVDMWRGCLS